MSDRRIKFHLDVEYQQGKGPVGYALVFTLQSNGRAFGLKGWRTLGEGRAPIKAKDWVEAIAMKRVAQRFADRYGKTPNLCAPVSAWGRA